MPGNNGGANWSGAAVDPAKGTLIVVSKDLPSLLKLEPETAPDASEVRYVSGFGFMIASDGLSPIAPPWTSLTAYDLNEGAIKWKIPLGEVPELAAKGVRDTGSHYPKVGPVVTAGGLIFTGTRDRKIRAFDVETGKVAMGSGGAGRSRRDAGRLRNWRAAIHRILRFRASWADSSDPGRHTRSLRRIRVALTTSYNSCTFTMSSDSQAGQDRKTAIAPMLSVRNGTRAIEFYKAAFGAGELYRVESESGEVVARLSVGAPNSGSPTSHRNTSTSVPSLSAVVLCGW